MNMEFTSEQLQKIKATTTPAELLALAEAEGVPLTEAEATACFTRLNPPAGELTDQELEAVSGGGCAGFEKPEFHNGDHVMQEGRTCCNSEHSDYRGAQYILVSCHSPYWIVTGSSRYMLTGRIYDVKCPGCGMSTTVHGTLLWPVN